MVCKICGVEMIEHDGVMTLCQKLKVAEDALVKYAKMEENREQIIKQDISMRLDSGEIKTASGIRVLQDEILHIARIALNKIRERE
ncbi:MAG: hypothetical protein SFW66_09010 [Gammaproteobacteria bacterium]|nr:hypothetical protein [Gammaproteobacteria bacterium]